MKERCLDKILFDSIVPHIARAQRKQQGYRQGKLTCQVCGAKNARKNRQRTAYVDSDNMATLCPKCQKEADKYWDDMWSDYYSMVM